MKEVINNKWKGENMDIFNAGEMELWGWDGRLIREKGMSTRYNSFSVNYSTSGRVTTPEAIIE